MRGASGNALARALSTLTGALPLSTRVELRERLGTVGWLDHPEFDIEMAVETPIELFRLGSCRKEPETVAWIEERIGPGDVFYDVGANVGAYSLLADRQADRRATVVAFEPGFATFSTLVRNVLLNEAQSRVTTLNIALSDDPGLVPITYSTLQSGGATHDFGRAEEGAAWQHVLAFRLDDLEKTLGLAPPTALKLDVDGAELAVLRGGTGTLARPELRSVLVEVVEGEPETELIAAILGDCGLELASKHKHERSGVSNFIFDRA